MVFPPLSCNLCYNLFQDLSSQLASNHTNFMIVVMEKLNTVSSHELSLECRLVVVCLFSSIENNLPVRAKDKISYKSVAILKQQFNLCSLASTFLLNTAFYSSVVFRLHEGGKI